MKRVLGYICVAALLLGVSNSAFGWSDMTFRGDDNGWAVGPAFSSETRDGVNYWVGSYQANGGLGNEYKLYASDSGGSWFGYNGTTTPGNFYSFSSSEGANATMDSMDAGNYYTFTVQDASNLGVIIQETASAPVTISAFNSEVSNGGKFDPTDTYASGSVQNNANTVSVTLGATPSAGENVYIYYSTDNFATQANSDIIQATGSGTSWHAAIGDQAENTTISYYVLTSTFSEAALDGVGTEADVLFRALDETQASTLNYSTYDLGDSFHIQSQTAGGAGEDMLAGSNGSNAVWDGTEAEARIYSGNVFQNVGEAADQSSYTLNYRVNGGAWQSQAGAFNNTSGNDKYWLSTLDLTGVSSGSVVQYYLEYNYTTGEDTTFVYANGGASYMSGNESLAQTTPFSFQYGQAAAGDSSVPEPNTMSMAVLAGSLMLSWRHRIKMQRKARNIS